QEYWSNSDTQLSAMGALLQELTQEVGKISKSIEDAKKVRKSSMVPDLEKKRNELTAISQSLLDFVPAGERSSQAVVRVSESWEKLKGAKGLMDYMAEASAKIEDGSTTVSKKIDAESKRLERLKKEIKDSKSASKLKDLGEQESKVKNLERSNFNLNSALKTAKKRTQEIQSSTTQLTENLKRSVASLASSSGSNMLVEGSGKPLKDILTAAAIPAIRFLVEASVSKIPKEYFAKRQESAALDYEKIKQECELTATKAKERVRCKRCREMIETLLSGAVDHDSVDVKACVAFLQDGDIFEARKSLEKAFSSGNIHEYARTELDAMAKELLTLYDRKGEVSKLENKLRAAGTEMLGARLDIMRLDYLQKGVHSPKEFWQSAMETIAWLEGLGMVFDTSLKEGMDKLKDSQDIFRFSSTKGLNSEQVEASEVILQALKSETELLMKVKDPEIPRKISESEVSIAISVSASENFGNPLFLKSLISGDKNALAIMKRIEESSGSESALIGYIDAAIKEEALGLLASDLGEVSEGTSEIKDLCNEISKLRVASEKKGSSAVSQKIELGRKISELMSEIEKITGEKPDEELTSKISDSKLTGPKLYSEVISSKHVSTAIRAKLLSHLSALEGLRGQEATEVPLKSVAG
ncbi:MAG: hypothetical protein ABIF01_04075, partial [Candidatus Micrarchaeota archaeon]